MGGRGSKGGGGPSSPRRGKGQGTPGGGGDKGGPGGGGKGKKGKGQGSTSPGGVTTTPGGGGSGGGSTIDLQPKPPAWPDNLRLKPHNRRTRAQDLARDIEAVNPRWQERTPGNKDTDEQWDINCTRCAATVELRARGKDVTAEPAPRSKTDKTHADITNKWVDADGNERPLTKMNELTGPDATGKEKFEALKAKIKSYGDGARGFMVVEWNVKAGGGGHIFNWEVRDGKILWMDGQSNEFNLGQGWMNNVARHSGFNGFMRVDDLTPSDRLVKDGWVRERTNGEVNAPSAAEMVLEQRRLYGGDTSEARELRAVFKEAWQMIRTGQKPKPEKYDYDPALLEAYLRGIAFAERPA